MLEFADSQDLGSCARKSVGVQVPLGALNLKGEQMAKHTQYAKVVWTATDVKTLRPKWSYKKCEEWLQDNARHMQDRTIELGWEVMEALL